MEPVEQEGRKDLKMSIATHSIRMKKNIYMLLTLKLQHTKEIK